MLDSNDCFDKNKINQIDKLLGEFWTLMKSFDEVKIVEKETNYDNENLKC